MQDPVYTTIQTNVQDIDYLKWRLIDIWDSPEQSVIDDTINQWCSRLRVRVCAKGGGISNILCNLQLQKQKLFLNLVIN